jgi:5'(3')-deoxyribonucleotidase
MDEVLYPLSETIIDLYNIDWKDNFDWKTNTKFNWQDTSAPESYFENLLLEKDIFFMGKPTNDTILYLNKLHEEGYIIKIITFPNWEGYCAADKIRWLKKYFSWIDINKDVIMTGDKGICARSNRILIDDNSENINNWKNAGGIALQFKNFGFPISENNQFENMQQVYEYIKNLD